MYLYLGMRTFGLEGASFLFQSMDRIWHLTIPALMSAIAGTAVLSRYVRSQMLEVIHQDYMRTARAKGLPQDQVIYRHGLRNALLPFHNYVWFDYSWSYRRFRNF